MNPPTEENKLPGDDGRAGPAPEPSAEVGAVLRAARLKKGHSLEAVVQQTRIPRKFVTALEENRFDDFPASVYLRGFLKTYCDFLELEFEPLWQATARSSAPAEPAAAAPQAAPPAPAAPAAPKKTLKPAPREKKAAREEPHHAEEEAEGLSPAGPALLGILAAAGLALVWGLKAPKAVPPAAPPEAMPASLARYSSKPEPTLAIEYLEEVWVSVSLDGKTLFEGRVPAGVKQDWAAKRAIALRLSDPKAVALTLNGAAYPLGSPDAAGLYRIDQ